MFSFSFTFFEKNKFYPERTATAKSDLDKN